MIFEVRLSISAELDLEEVIDHIARDSKTHAKKWMLEFQERVISLREMPLRHTLIPESDELGLSLRSLNHYSHRIIYMVDENEKVVSIVRIYHSARKPLTKDNL